MGISKFRFTLFACLGVLFAFSATAEAQQIIPAAYKRIASPAPVIYQDAVASDCGCSGEAVGASSVISPVTGGCATGGCATGGCGLGSRLGRECNLGDQWTLFGRGNEEPALNIGGWFQFGYHEESNDLFNTNPNEFNLHQGWLFVEKVADGSQFYSGC